MVLNGVQNFDKPRIISEIKKNCLSRMKITFSTNKPKISGKLLWNISSREWALRWAQVREGSLFVYDCEDSGPEFRVPLRRLNLKPSSRPRTFSLTRGPDSPPFTFQTLTEDEYEKWVKTLAVELIRQTPLQDVRFLDIISITREKEFRKSNFKRMGFDTWDSTCEEFQLQEHKKKWRKLPRDVFLEMDPKKMKIRKWTKIRPNLPNLEDRRTWTKICDCKKEKTTSDESGIGSGDENNSARNSQFTSVKEKKLFFESLGSEKEESDRKRSPDLVRSNSIGEIKRNQRESSTLKKRANSLFDLNNAAVPVKEICRIFEKKEKVQEEEEEEEKEKEEKGKSGAILLNQRRLQRGERKLCKLRIQIAEVEETIKIIAQDLKSIGQNTLKRSEGLEIFAALQRRLQEENSRLERLQEETIKVVKDNQRIIIKLDKLQDKV